MVDRIATFSGTNSILKQNLRIQAKYAEATEQTASGQVSDDYKDIADKTSRLLNLESEYNNLVSQSENAQTALDRCESMYSVMSSMTDIVQNFLSNLSSAISTPGYDSDNIAAIATEQYEETESLLNAKTAGIYTFSGSATQSEAADLSDAAYTAQTVPSTENFSYYQGNDYIQTVEVADGVNIDYGVTADEPAFEKILRALNLVINNASDSTALSEAYDLMTTAQKELTTLQSTVSEKTSTIDRYINQNMEQVNLIDSMISDIKEVDTAEVATRLKQLETQLETSYAVTTKILDLKLLDFL